MASFESICNGWGIQKVPIELAKGLSCPLCGTDFKTIHLYTDQCLVPHNTSLRAYSKMADNLVGNCYCKHHIIYLYDDREV